MESEAIDVSVSSTGDPEHFMQAIQLADSIERLGLSKNMVEKYMIRTLRHLRGRLEGLQS